jgi:triacylglycerol lipase
LQQLAAAGVPAATVNLEPVYASIDDYAPAVADAIARLRAATGRPPVLVCHSMGGLAFRAWWRASGLPGDVAHAVTIGTPHQQMRLRSDWLSALERHEAVHPLPPLTCWYSNCDNIVFPCATAMHESANNRFLPGEAHVALAFRPEVIEDCIALLRAQVSR